MGGGRTKMGESGVQSDYEITSRERLGYPKGASLGEG